MNNQDLFIKAVLDKLAERGPGHSSGTVAEAWERKKGPAWGRGRTAPAAVRHNTRKFGMNTHQFGAQQLSVADSTKRKAPNMQPHVPSNRRADD